ISSSFELETQLILANDLFNTDSEEIIEKINELQKMIVGFKKSLDVKYDSSLTSNF
ncbi:MAG: four helix bundle protein, partial [Flavobacteriia bacterium]|nr:four helix bundle protein [Flavobacteriia bacterium]